MNRNGESAIDYLDDKVIKRFWDKVDIKGKDECWEWKASDNGTGYGKFYLKGWQNSEFIYAHRVSYILYYGKIPKNYEIDHLCRNRICVNPQHLEAVLGKINILRGISCSAQNARKTHCIKGHLLSDENLYHLGEGEKRICKICRKENYEKSNKIRKKIYNQKDKCKLNDDKVLDILKLNKNGVVIKEIQEIFGVSYMAIYNVIKNKSWRHVPR